MKEVKVESTSDGLEFSEDLSAEELSKVINDLADTYCTNPNCTSCPICDIAGKAHRIRQQLLSQ